MTKARQLLLFAVMLFATIELSSCHASKRSSSGCGCRMEMPLRS